MSEPSPTEQPPVDPEFGTLNEALAHFEIELEQPQVELLDRYREVLWRFNEQINLTRHTTLAKFVGRDVVDSLELAKHIAQGNRVLDVGSGGGVPGLVIAICRPDLKVSVCESTQKKAKVLFAMVEELGLSVPVLACRAEEALELSTYDTLTARAVAPLAKLLYWFNLHWDAFDELLLIKGKSWVEERAEARHRGFMKPLELRKLGDYPMLGGGESVILRLWRKETDEP
ncbi:16S rRNA (guanine(527)-N(7))-methyltransferase RsmG [Adhaeretor mobilis]|uniref:Ribosomal RNA small subunit methyltransferase G n=1 Tax=Adhaeretor mobilis TaxID=1930276 RepID=A0A517MSH3_9BACT|nr:16S rRNA (guanine(527)-N(7))-methyltransferase RsmG [Adhaeretor mobilis]QDS97819.1 Ribosomal RNA small subunit methyltransferase G [Adhaeretor mobilis]